MKKIYSFLLALVLTCLSASSAWAQTTFTENNLLYVVRSSTEKTVALALRVASGTSDTSAYTGAVSIPSTVTHDGVTYTVIAINTKAFKNSTVTSVTIPATVTTIGEAAFDNTYQLKKLTFSDASTPISIVTRYFLDFGDAAKELYVGRDLTFTGDYTGRRQFNNVTKATFGGKATAISDYILDGATTLKTLTIGSSVKTIGQYAFRSCGTDESITEMTVSMGTAVTTMGRNAFENCSKLKSITLPTTLREIPERAFYATGLTALTIPANVTSIGYQAFNATDALTSVHINDASTTLTLTTNYFRDFGTAAKELYVGRNLTFTGDYTRRAQFEGVTKATLGGKMTTINDFMLEDNKNLATLVIGNSVTRIGTDAFQYCGQDVEELKVTMGTKVQAMDGWTFQSCSTLKCITLPATLKTIGQSAFQNSGLTAVTIPASVDSIGYQAFQATDALASIRFSDATTPVKLVTNYFVDFGTADKELYVGRDLTFTGDYTGRRQFDNVTKATFGGKATAIAVQVLDGNAKLKTLTIGASVKTIGQYAFRSCGTDESITEMTVSMGTAVTTMGRNAFENCSKLKSITLPTTLREIPERAFYATGLTALTIPANVTSIGYQAFHATDALTNVRFDDASTTLTLATNYYRDFGTAAKELYVGRNLTFTGDYTRRAQFEGVTKATLGGNMTTINDFMLEDNKNLATLVIGNNVTRIGTDAFQYCGQNVEELKVTMGTKVQAMDGWTFQSCSTLKSITLPATLKTIGQSAFHSSGLTAVTIPASVDSIGYQAFHATDALASVRFDDAATPVKLVTNYYVDFGTADKELYVGRNLTFKGDYTGRRQFDNVKEVSFGALVTAIPAKLFEGSTQTDVHVSWLTPITIASSVFSGDTYQQATLWVPGGTMETYENADVWKLFVHKDFGSFLFTIKSDNGGTIALGDVSVKNGTKTTLVERGGNAVVTLTPATGYELNKVTVGGVNMTSSVSGGKLTLTNVQAEATVSATFKLKTFTITKAATTNGTITLSATTVQYNKSYTVTFAPATGYELATVSVNGTDKTSSVSDNKLTVTNVKENQTVSATFQKQTYAVSITATGGQVTASTLAPKYQDNVVLTIVEDEDSELQKLMVNGTDVTSRVSGGKYTITKVTGNVTVVATFRSNKEYILMSDSRQMFSCTEDLDFTGVSGLKAYIASGYDASTGAAIMTQVQSVPANTGLLLIGTKGTTYKVPYATSSAFYVNLLLPVSAPKKVPATEGSYTNFLFTTQDGAQAFFKADGTKTLTAGSAYLSVPTTAVASVKRINVVIGETVVGIDDLNALDAPTTPDAAVYDLGGRKVADRLTDGRLPKGIYVVRGKKVVKK